MTIFDLIRKEGREPGGIIKKKIVKWNQPLLMQFVYPTIPGKYNSKYKFVRHVVGIDGITGKVIGKERIE